VDRPARAAVKRLEAAMKPFAGVTDEQGTINPD
jgi:hypothetical protein